MTSSKHFDDLPNEILLKIFSYLDIEDLAIRIQHVCQRWREVSQDNKLWKKSVFTPTRAMAERDVVKHLQNMPALRSFCALRRVTHTILNALCKYCKDVRSIEFHKTHNMKLSFLQMIVKHFPQIECLKVSLPFSVFSEQLRFTELIGECEALTTLSLNENADLPSHVYEGVLLPIAVGCPSLKHLFLGNYEEIDEDIQKLLELKKDNLLSFSYKISLTREISEYISQCTKLQFLEIENFNDNLFYSDIQPLENLTNLKHLALRFCSLDVVDHLPGFFSSASFSQLVHLDLSETYHINGSVLNAVFENCTQLQHLNVSGGQSLQNEDLVHIGNCSQLEYLDLSACMELTDASIKFVGAGCHCLKYLDVSGCYRMSDKVIEYIVRLKELRILKFNYNDLKGVKFHLIPNNLLYLTEFYLENCMYLDEMYKEELHNKMPKLKIIVARKCSESYGAEDAIMVHPC